jgi:hypothetical protein
MSDHETVLELINAEIDGVMTGAQRAELNRQLLADPATRALREDMTRTCRSLDTMHREDLPPGLHDAIVAGLPVAAPRSHAIRRQALLASRPLLRYAAAFIGGLLVSTLALQLGKFDSTLVGAGDAAGTIAAPMRTEARMTVDLPQAQGVVTLAGPAHAPQVVTSLAAQQPISIVTQLHEDGAVDVQVIDDATATVLQRGKLRIGSER